MSRTIRVLWKNCNSGWRNFNWNGVIDKNSVVHIAASEGHADPGSSFGIVRTRGDARISVENVRPHGETNAGGGVEFWLAVGWEAPINVVTDITVVDAAEQGFIA